MERLKNYLAQCEKRCAEYMSSYSLDDINPPELKIGATEYFNRGGKRLRPAFLSLSAGAVGGKIAEEGVTPAMVSVELFHTFTLVHDDIIDNDSTRRGGKTVHVLVSDKFNNAEYGRDVAILAGDTLHALAVRTLTDCIINPAFSPKTVLSVLRLLEGECINELLSGETVDTKMGLIKDEEFSVGKSEVTLEMMRQKTGVLFSYSARAGAMLGLDTDDSENPDVIALGKFAELCGIAFQLQDDILGITSDTKTLGKPIGSDIREGKKTIILQEAYKNSDSFERKLIESTVGNDNARDEDIEKVREILLSRKGVEKADSLAKIYIHDAMKELKKIKASDYTKLLETTALFMTNRKM
ncbi:MAG: polyprenyl synthetase family protein [Ruminococcaceae bacterium]|nr:polyprenyl synthetase family protein [Oscillospiraceae bacterium]